jgi:hypothetical protein
MLHEMADVEQRRAGKLGYLGHPSFLMKTCQGREKKIRDPAKAESRNRARGIT